MDYLDCDFSAKKNRAARTDICEDNCLRREKKKVDSYTEMLR